MRLFPVAVCLSLAVMMAPAWAEANYRAMAAEAIASQLFDPFSVKKAMANPPMKYKNGTIAMCVKLYAKNRMGAYVGQSIWSVVFTKDGSQVRFAHDVTNMGSSCATEGGYTAFKELENY
jgi:hypothetical protein